MKSNTAVSILRSNPLATARLRELPAQKILKDIVTWDSNKRCEQGDV
jgi:hypothetical protein